MRRSIVVALLLLVGGCTGSPLGGLSAEGLKSVAQAKTAAMQAARQSALLCEHTRFGVTSFAKFADVGQLTWVITGKQLSQASAQRYSAAGPRVLRV